eukprot:gene4916-5057_t
MTAALSLWATAAQLLDQPDPPTTLGKARPQGSHGSPPAEPAHPLAPMTPAQGSPGPQCQLAPQTAAQPGHWPAPRCGPGRGAGPDLAMLLSVPLHTPQALPGDQ